MFARSPAAVIDATQAPTAIEVKSLSPRARESMDQSSCPHMSRNVSRSPFSAIGCDPGTQNCAHSRSAASLFVELSYVSLRKPDGFNSLSKTSIIASLVNFITRIHIAV